MHGWAGLVGMCPHAWVGGAARDVSAVCLLTCSSISQVGASTTSPQTCRPQWPVQPGPEPRREGGGRYGRREKGGEREGEREGGREGGRREEGGGREGGREKGDEWEGEGGGGGHEGEREGGKSSGQHSSQSVPCHTDVLWNFTVSKLTALTLFS